jgi:hypothetical protein
MKKIKDSKQSRKKLKRPKVMPAWQECSWRRRACGKMSCPICGRIARDRQKHILAGEDPDDLHAVFEDVGASLSEALMAIKQDALAHGIEISNIDDIKEPPPPETFPLHEKVREWWEGVMEIVERAHDEGEPWLLSEAGQDFSWYASTLLAKTARQLDNRWHISEQDSYGEFDYNYTRYVLSEVIAILKKSLPILISLDTSQKKQFQLALICLSGLGEEIIKI